MNPVLVLGAGRSSVSLLDYLNKFALSGGFRFTVADADPANLQLRTAGMAAADTRIFTAADPESLAALVKGFSVVISLLPPPMHPKVARACLKEGVHLLTASYESAEMQAMASDIRNAGLIFLNECGLDPGIDHMSAMEMMDEIRREGGNIIDFKSYCGGLVADECDDNPFRYKISWNPRNVVNAGKSGGLYLENGGPAFLSYSRLFAETEEVHVPGWGDFEAYPNRDSIPYREIYGLKGISGLKRGTLRKSGFSKRWNCFVQSGMTDESVVLQFPEGADYLAYLRSFFPSPNPVELILKFIPDPIISADFLQLFKDGSGYRKLYRTTGTPADFLLDLIVHAWQLNPSDKDLVVMLHSFIYFNSMGEKMVKNAWFGIKGKDSLHTAMAQTVGLPLGIISKLILNACISQKGLLLPLQPEIYQPVLKELSSFGIDFQSNAQPYLKN